LAASLPVAAQARPAAPTAVPALAPPPPAAPAAPRRSPSEREALREKLRAIAEQARLEDQPEDDPAYTVYNEDIARLQQDILAVKQNLADARSRRSPHGAQPAE
ncbi:hypothetical protein, partial [Aurantimonas sp. 22II-16-19i]|uniref:hypothetical protein n=1 Tax=Aurantimonas sp. 22II-16-19i TaxID=1317114 RepID=UPI001593A26D